MSRYASGKHAYFISDRSGFRYPYKEMKIEWTGAAVGPDEFEPKHPQLEPVRHVADPEALANARPDSSNKIPALAKFPAFNDSTFEFIQNPVAFAFLGNVTLGGDVVQTVNHTELAGSFSATVTLGTAEAQVPSINTLTVTVANDGYGNKYYISGYSGAAPTITLNEGDTYRFDQSDNSNTGHPLRLSTTSDGTHAGGSEYTTGVTTNGTPGSAGAYTQITVASGAPTLYYYCTNHSGMGGQANTP